MQRQRSLIEVIFIVLFYAAGFFIGFKHGEHLTRVEIHKQLKQTAKLYETHIDSLLCDLQFVRTASDSAKQALVEREVEWFKQYLINRIAD